MFLTTWILTLWLAAPTAAAAWVDLPLPDADMGAPDAKAWRSYRESELTKVEADVGSGRALRVAVKSRGGGLRLETTPRGGLGNCVRLTVTYRVLSGGGVDFQVGPNTFNQCPGRLKSRSWETVTVDTGLIYDFLQVLHLSQSSPPGLFEIAGFRVQFQPGARRGPGPRRAIVSMDGWSPSDPLWCFSRGGNVAATATQDAETSAVERRVVIDGAAPGVLRQYLGVLPAGTRLALRGRCRIVRGNGVSIGFIESGKELMAAIEAKREWQDFELAHVTQTDGRPGWFIGRRDGAEAEFVFAGARVTAELADPLGSAVVNLPAERVPIKISARGPKDLYVAPPWPGMRRLRLNLEANSIWGFRQPPQHRVIASERGDEATLVQAGGDDPVEYAVSLKADRPDAVLIHVRVRNGRAKPLGPVRPVLCWQISGAYSPMTFAYCLIPRSGKPFPLDLGTPVDPRPAAWPRMGWVNATYAGGAGVSAEDRRRTQRKWIEEAGDFPLYARRLPGRNAWIAWVWPDAERYFGNTQTPCMHMNPCVPACPPGKTQSIFGRLLFFEGTWPALYAAAVREKQALETLNPPTVHPE